MKINKKSTCSFLVSAEMVETVSLFPKVLLLGGVVGPLLFVLVIWLEGHYDPVMIFCATLAASWLWANAVGFR